MQLNHRPVGVTRACALIVLLMFVTVSASATASVSVVGSLPWFKKVWKDASDWDIPKEIQVDYRVVGRYTKVDEQKITALITDGAEDQSHPQHSVLLQLQAQKQQPEFPENVCITILPNGWRVDKDREHPGLGPEQRWRTVAQGKQRWQLAPGQLLVTDKSEPEEHFSFDNEESTIREQLREHAWQGMGNRHGGRWRFVPISSEVDEKNRWTGVVRTTDGKVEKTFTGAIDTKNRLTVHSSTITQALGEYQYALGQSWTFDMVSPGGFLEADRIALKVIWESPDLGMQAERLLVAMSSVPMELDRDAFLSPPVDGMDVVRGEVSIKTVRRVQDSHETRSVIDEQGVENVIDADAGRWWRSDDKRRGLQFWGTVVGVFVVVSIIYVRIRAHA